MATSPYLTVGSTIATGDTNAANSYELDNDSVMELAGIELIGPVSSAALRQKIESIKILIDGEEVADTVFNEMTAPAYHRSSMVRYPFFGGVGRYANQPEGFCFNLGLPLLMGGSPMDACPKIGPKETLGFEIKAPATAENGATINNNLIIRASLVEAKTIEVVERTLATYGTMSGGNVDQTFSIYDLARSADPVVRIDKTVPLALNRWTALYGGEAASKPYMKNYITYAQNALATTANSAYRFTRDGRYVLHPFMDLSWNLDKDEAVRVTHVGVLENDHIKYMRMWVSGRETPGNDWHIVNNTENMFPMPLDPNADTDIFVGPAVFPRPELIYNEKAYLELKDDGTSVGAWASSTQSAMVAMWGKKFEGLEM